MRFFSLYKFFTFYSMLDARKFNSNWCSSVLTYAFVVRQVKWPLARIYARKISITSYRMPSLWRLVAVKTAIYFATWSGTGSTYFVKAGLPRMSHELLHNNNQPRHCLGRTLFWTLFSHQWLFGDNILLKTLHGYTSSLFTMHYQVYFNSQRSGGQHNADFFEVKRNKKD